MRKDFEAKEKAPQTQKYKSAESIIKHLRLNDPSEEKRLKEDYLNFVHSKRLT